jgi:hypothetical protein
MNGWNVLDKYKAIWPGIHRTAMAPGWTKILKLADATTLRTMQNIIILYGLVEAEVERWHPFPSVRVFLLVAAKEYGSWAFVRQAYVTKTSERLKPLVFNSKDVPKI